MTTNSIIIPTEFFNYTVTYYEDEVMNSNTLHIEAVHNKSFLSWVGTTDHESLNSDKNSTKKLLELELKTVFDIFTQFSNNTLGAGAKIKFPIKYKSAEDQICIEIIIVADIYGGETVEDTRTIFLDSKKINFEDRIDKKIEQINFVIDHRIKIINADFAEKIDVLCASTKSRDDILNADFKILQDKMIELVIENKSLQEKINKLIFDNEFI